MRLALANFRVNLIVLKHARFHCVDMAHQKCRGIL